MAFCVQVGPHRLTAQPGQLLLDCLRDAGLAPEAPCGGQGTCGKCVVRVNGEQVRSCAYRVTSDIVAVLPRSGSPEILASGKSAGGKNTPLREGWRLACDIGTTTVVCSLMDPEGREAAVSSMLNPQRCFGADVVSRIRCALASDMEAMTGAIRKAVETLVRDCCRQAGIVPEQIGVVSIVGNSCMRQLFLGLTPENLVRIPFGIKPETSTVADASAYISCCTGALMPLPADISAYLGTDTLACILASGLRERADTVLLVDIGTNGEMVLSHRGRMIACATAAGPALEGANISRGMGGCAGAIDHVYPDGFTVIGGGEETGICGSGIVDAVAVMLRNGVLNSRGRVLTEDHSWHISPRVSLTQEDIRQVQLAKGAVAAGIYLMCEHLGITPGQIDRCILAGAFGTYMDPDSACRIGLLPEELAGKVESIGNGALAGAKLLAGDRELLQQAEALAKTVTVLELASLPGFRRSFAGAMGFREEENG